MDTLLIIMTKVGGVRYNLSRLTYRFGGKKPPIGSFLPCHEQDLSRADPKNFMRCPYCHVDNDRVLDTRTTEDGYVVRRKRACGSCHRKFTTLERLEEASIRVVKRDQTREPLDREKIRRGIERACSKRPISSQQIENLVQEVESEVYGSWEIEVPTARIGEIVMRHLAGTDEVAYIRFASVYHEFEDSRDFFHAIETFRTTSPPPD